MFRQKLLLVAVFTCSFPSIALAALMEADLLSAGDALLTQDTDTGLEWLDITYSQAASRAVVDGGWKNLTTTHGFRYATQTEVAALFTTAGIVDFSNSFGGSNLAGVQYLQSLLGVTENYAMGGVWDGTRGPLTSGLVELDTPVTHQIAVATLQIMDGFPGGRATVEDYISGTNVSRIVIGSFLVRETQVVPLPAAVWLFGSALAG